MVLYNFKATHSYKSFIRLLQPLVEIFPKNNKLSSSMYDVKKILNDLGLGYEKIHSCPHDYILYRKVVWRIRTLSNMCKVTVESV